MGLRQECHRRTAVEHFAGIDVSLEQSSVCVVDATGKIVREAKVASEPEGLVRFFRELGSSWAIPRASLRSVLTTIADSAAFTCRVSSNTAPNPASARPACSHCDKGPA